MAVAFGLFKSITYLHKVSKYTRVMRLHTFTWISITCLLLMVSVGSACKRDKCKHVTCVNGTCVDGNCQCSTGYFKDDCSAVINAGYDGGWALTEECTAGADHYTVQVAAVSGNLTQLRISGLWGKPNAVLADLGADGYTLIIPKQQISTVELAATGTINDTQDEIQLDYQISYLGFAQPFDVCKATITKN